MKVSGRAFSAALAALLTLPHAGMADVGAAADGAGRDRPSADRAPAARPATDRPVILITGSTDGLGREVALRLAATGAHIIVHGRNIERGQAVVAEIESDGRGSASFHAADLASLEQVRTLAGTILDEYDRLDMLINNAGIWRNQPPTRAVSDDGHELHFAVNYLAGYLLTRLLLPRLRESAPARIINVASGAQSTLDFDNLMLEEGYSPGRAYGQSKLAQILFTVDLAEELAGTGVDVYALHPATLMDTPMVRAAGATPRSTVDEGATAVVHLATAPGLPSGQYFNGLQPTRAHAQAYDDRAHARLRAVSRELTGGH